MHAWTKIIKKLTLTKKVRKKIIQLKQDVNLPDTSEQIYISSLALLKMLKHGIAISKSF